MRPSPKYRAAHTGIHVSPAIIPVHLRATVEDGLATGVRKGKVRNKVGMWGNLSPYYANSITIDKRWDQTLSNGGLS